MPDDVERLLAESRRLRHGEQMESAIRLLDLAKAQLRQRARQAGRTDHRTPAQHYEVLMELGDCHAALAQYADARACYTRAGRLAPERPQPHIALGVVAVEGGYLPEAQAHFRDALQLSPYSAEAYGGLAMVAQQRQAYGEALELYLRCLELDSDNLVALLGLFQTSCQMGTFAKIIYFLEIYLARHPDDASVLFCLATLQAREGLLDQAAESLLGVLRLEPGKVEAANLMAQVRLAKT